MEQFEGKEITDAYTYMIDPDGTIVLSGVSPIGALVPFMIFTRPEVFKQFRDATEKAYNAFVPKAVRDAFEVLDNYDKPSNDEEATGTGKEDKGVPALPIAPRGKRTSPRIVKLKE